MLVDRARSATCACADTAPGSSKGYILYFQKDGALISSDVLESIANFTDEEALRYSALAVITVAMQRQRRRERQLAVDRR